MSGKISYNCLLGWLGMIISPILSLPFAIVGMIGLKKWGFVLWAFFMGLLGILYPPTGDIYRYYIDFKTISHISGSDFLLFLSFRFDYLLSIIEYILSRLGIPFDFYKFIYNFICYYILGILYLKIIYHYGNKASINLRIIVLLTIITFSISNFLFRFDFSKILFIYGCYLIFFDNNKKGWLYLIISCLNHLSMTVLLVFIILAKLKFFSFSKKILIAICICCLLLDAQLATSLLSFLPINIVDRYAVYLDGYWAKDFIQDHSILFRLQRYSSIAFTYILMLIYIMIYDKKHIKYENFVNALILVTCISSPFITVFYRFSSVLFLAVKFYFLRTFNFTKRSFNYLYIIMSLTILLNFMNLWSSRRQLSISEIYNIVLPAPCILSFSYTDDWISNNVFENGDFKHN